MSVRDEFHPAGRAYVHPRASDCILGGTLDENQWGTEPDPATAAAIIARCTEIVPAIANAAVIGHLAGLRPGRPEVRLEENPPAGGPRVVHNYGHGGAGVTLSWGCAEDVTRILLPGAAQPSLAGDFARPAPVAANSGVPPPAPPGKRGRPPVTA